MQTETASPVARAIAEQGYAVAPGALDAATCDALNAAIAHCRARPGPNFRTLSPPGQSVVQSDLFRWADTPAIGAVATQGRLPALAAEVFGTDRVILMEDQWFYSEAGSSTPSPWHQDHPYHPLEPSFLTIWVPLDAPPGPVGLKVAARSHRGRLYGPIEFSATEATLGATAGVLAPTPDIDADPDAFAVATPAAGRGDAVLIDSRTLHAAGGHCSGTFRRISIRYAHPETRITPRSWPIARFWSDHAFAATPGAALAGHAFPMIRP